MQNPATVMLHPNRFFRCYWIINILIVLKIHAANSECYEPWSVRSEPEICTNSDDCKDDDAECIYSLKDSAHICCRPKPGTIFPQCPEGWKMLILGKNRPVLCPTDITLEDDGCPKDYKCLPSATNLTQKTQPNNICCKPE